MTKLKRAGFFRELAHGDPDGPELRSLVSDVPQRHEAEIAAYLAAGLTLLASPGVVTDVVSDAHQKISAAHILTDGVWAWPLDLVHYVRTYHIRLPDEFVQHMRERDWAPPNDDDVDLMSLSL